MASNPIQRRARQSFLIGFLIALVIMAVVVAFLFMRINTLNEEKEALVITEATVYTVVDEVKSGDEITADMLVPKTIETVNGFMEVGSYLTPGSFGYNEETGEPLKYFAKIDIPTGSVMIESMVYAEGEQTTDDERIIEYNMIVLPSQLSNGNYVDIRYQLANGQDYIVLSKKRIEQCTDSTIWMNMSEMDINTINSAIVDSYLTSGSMLYATIYKEPGMQNALTQTYAIRNEVLVAMENNPNIVNDAKTALLSRWNSQNQGTQRAAIDGYTEGMDEEQKAATVAGSRQEEITTIETMRSEYVSALEGTGVVGTTY